MTNQDAIERQALGQTRVLMSIAAGDTLASITGGLSMPTRPEVCGWLWDDPDFVADFRAARGRSTDLLAEQCLDIADEEATTAAAVANKRLRIDARLKLMARWDRVAERQPPRQRLDMSQLTDEQLAVLASIPVVERAPRATPASLRPAPDPANPSLRHHGPDRADPLSRHPGLDPGSSCLPARESEHAAPADEEDIEEADAIADDSSDAVEPAQDDAPADAPAATPSSSFPRRRESMQPCQPAQVSALPNRPMDSRLRGNNEEVSSSDKEVLRE